jgi:hypothetical protein
MKLFEITGLFAVANAQRGVSSFVDFQDMLWSRVPGERGGKHGRVPIATDRERYIWEYPLCVTVPDSPGCDQSCIKTFRSKSGKIVVNNDKNYQSYRSCLWTIEVPTGYEITMMFDRDAGFDVEYHQKCGYDRLHVFSGTYDDVKNTAKRHARFCGPRWGDKPYDGSRKVTQSNGRLPFWDKGYNLHDNKAFIGFDADQSNVGKGFVLKWWSKKTQEYNFNDVYDSYRFLKDMSQFHFQNVMFNSLREKEVLKGKLENMMKKCLVALENNPGQSDPKKTKRRRCARSDKIAVTVELADVIKEMHDDPKLQNFNSVMERLTELTHQYLGNCRVANKRWPDKIASFKAYVNSRSL